MTVQFPKLLFNIPKANISNITSANIHTGYAFFWCLHLYVSSPTYVPFKAAVPKETSNCTLTIQKTQATEYRGL